MTNFGLIGTGYWGKNFIRVINEEDFACLIQTCDLSAKNNSNQLIPSTTDYRDICANSNIDAVVIATNASTHYRVAKAVISSGKHVFVEKPLTLSSKECSSLITLANKKKISLFCGYIYLYNDYIKQIAHIVKENILGKPISFSCQRKNNGPIRYDVDSMWDLAPHDISILNFVFGMQPTRIFADKQNTDLSRTDKPNYSLLKLSFGNISGIIETDWLYPEKIRKIEIICEEGIIRFLETEQIKLRVHRRKNNKLTEIALPLENSSEPLKSEFRYFLSSIKNPNKNKNLHDEYVNITRILEIADKSFNLKREVII